MTRWAKDVSPARALPEYPRPQMVRREWKSLNGLWDYAVVPLDSASPEKMDGRILVPFPVESALSGVMRRMDGQHLLWYRRQFTIPQSWSHDRVLLHFGAVDWKTRVMVNGRGFAEHAGGYDPFTIDITEALQPMAPQTIDVVVWDGTEATQARGKQSLHPGGIFYTPTTGIWQSVWVEPAPYGGIDALHMAPDLAGSSLRLTVEAGADTTVQATALDGDRPVGTVNGPANAELALPIPEPRLWTPSSPFLYGLRVTLSRRGRQIDQVSGYFGMRSIGLGKDAAGRVRILLNGQFLFQVGTLDQGFWPDGIYTAPTDAALRSDIETLKRLGFNMTRKHVKVEPDRWYYWCDRLGLLVWQDMPSTFLNNERSLPAADIAAAHAQFEQELDRLVETHWNHPCIIQWVVFNEGWGQYDTRRLVERVQTLDPARLVDDASGWTDAGAGSVIDRHDYPGPAAPQPEANRASVLGEFGGLGLGVDGHTWAKRAWGYKQLDSTKLLTAEYVRLLRQAWRLRDEAGLSAVVYTQTSDVETECNGLLTYDRAVVKVDPAAARRANLGLDRPGNRK